MSVLTAGLQPWVLITTGIHDRGGQDKANYALAQYLLESGHRVHLVCHSVDSTLAAHPLATFHRVPHPGGPFFISEQLLDGYGRAVARRITGEFPQARILVNGGNCLWPGINWSHYVHGAWVPRNGSAAPLWFRGKAALNQKLNTWREGMAYRRARIVLTNSDDTRYHIQRLYDVEPERIRTVHLGCDPDWAPAEDEERSAARQEFGIGTDEAAAVFVGGIGWDDRKGFDVVVDCWRELYRMHRWDVRLIVAGGGSALGEWQQRVDRLGLNRQIQFLGFTTRVRQLLAAADLLLSPVRYEPFGLNVQEAICRGVPAIVSARAGVAERYQAEVEQALLQDPDDTAELMEKLLLWRGSIPEWRAGFRSLSAKLRRYTWPEMAARMAAAADAALAEAGVGR